MLTNGYMPLISIFLPFYSWVQIPPFSGTERTAKIPALANSLMLWYDHFIMTACRESALCRRKCIWDSGFRCYSRDDVRFLSVHMGQRSALRAQMVRVSPLLSRNCTAGALRGLRSRSRARACQINHNIRWKRTTGGTLYADKSS